MCYNIIYEVETQCFTYERTAMADLKLVIAKNIAELRREAQMTQFELAERLNYSDKAVSKWERGESVPDIVVLKEIADIFSVTVDFLLCEEHPKKKKFGENLRIKMKNHAFITGMSITLVWLIALALFTVGDVFREYAALHHWLVFVYAVPMSLIVWLVFNAQWFKAKMNFVIISLLMWATLASIFVSLIVYAGVNVRFLILLGIPGQIIIVLWSRIKTKKQ